MRFEEKRRSFEAHKQEALQDANERIDRAREIARHPVQNAEDALAHQRPDGVIGEWKDKETNELVADANIFQKVADRTHGILTPGNLVTLFGVGMSVKGIQHYRRGENVRAATYMFIGRFVGDIGDGAAAAVTKTRGAPGALLDATADKLLAAGFIAAAVEQGDMTRSEAATHALQQLRSARENTRLKIAGGEPNPSRFGKWGQAMLWFEAGSIVTAKAADELGFEQPAQLLRDAREITRHGAVLLNERAADEYAQRRISHISQAN